MFGTRYGKRVEEEVLWAGRKLEGTFTDLEALQRGNIPDKNLEPFIKRYVDKCINKNLKKI
jgi:hypothetical protein